MNVFLIDFDARLQAWHHLKKKLIDSSITQTCVEVDAWWQQAPLINHHLFLVGWAFAILYFYWLYTTLTFLLEKTIITKK